MDETTVAEKVDLRASNVEACRICLATDVRLHRLQDTHLGKCMESIGGFTESIDGLPNYVCYECAPTVIKCNKLLEKRTIAESTLQEIFLKNGMINKPLIKEQKKSDPKLQSPLDSYLKVNYYYMRYEDDSSMSGVTKAQSNPNEENIITLNNETEEESEDEIIDTDKIKEIVTALTQDKEVMKNFRKMNNIGQEVETINIVGQEDETINIDGQEDETINIDGQEDETIQDLSKDDEIIIDSDVEPIEEHIPVVEIVSDDEKMGDDFVSLKTYAVREDTVGGESPYDYIPLYNKRKMKPLGLQNYKKGKRKGRYQDEDKFVRRYFNIKRIHKPGRRPCKRYFCLHCPRIYNYVDDARDHTITGCTEPDNDTGAPSDTMTGRYPTPWIVCKGNH